MVGHTGDIPAAVAAVEAVDACLAEVVAAVHEPGGACIVTADHGNAEQHARARRLAEHRALDEPGAVRRHRARGSRCATAGSSPTSRRRRWPCSGSRSPSAMTGESLAGLAP